MTGMRRIIFVMRAVSSIVVLFGFLNFAGEYLKSASHFVYEE